MAIVNALHRSKPLLGTFVDISIVADLSDRDLLELSTLAYAQIMRIQDMMSFYDETSALSYINKNAFNHKIQLSSSLEFVIRHALKLSDLTGGLYDVTVADKLMELGGLPRLYPNALARSGSWRSVILNDGYIEFKDDIKIDLGGIAKGYAVDCAFDILRETNVDFDQITINAGGDLRLLNYAGQRIDIRHPCAHKKGEFISVPLKNSAMATSMPSYTNKNSLIINMKTYQALDSRESLSICAPTCMIADSLTKVLLLESDDFSLLEKFNADALRICPKGKISWL